MKFFSRFGLTTSVESPTPRVLAVLVLLTFHLMSSSAQGANPCSETSHDALTSCNYEVKSNYSLARAKCDNLPARNESHACVQQALQNKKSGFDECKAQFAKRQEICKTLGKDEYNPIINPADFVPVINNLYFPLTPGTTYIYEGVTEKGIEHNEVYVTHDTKVILGVTCTVVKDRVWVDGVLLEETIDWYAQDKDGNVWYFGENALEYEGGLVVGLGGSWMAGVDGAKPGIIMKAGRKRGIYIDRSLPSVWPKTWPKYSV